MKVAEAITQVRLLRDMADSMNDSRMKEALEMAIKALEQEPCNDCISRQAVLDTEYQVKDINGVDYVMLSEVQMKARKLPSVTAEKEVYSTNAFWKMIDEAVDKMEVE